MKLFKMIIAFSFALSVLLQPAQAWQAHFLVTYPILKSMPEISQQANIPAETLTDFLEAESENLVPFFKNMDLWQPSINAFPALPNDLIFNGKNDPQNRSLLQQFTDRARIHPQGDSEMHYDTLFVEYAPGEEHRIHNPLPLESVVLPSLLSLTHIPNPPLERVNPGELLSPFEIITSSVDEPDWGMDVNLFEDNQTVFGKRYQLGVTPKFANKDIAFGTQGPFHMGLFYETSTHQGQFLAPFVLPVLSRVTPEYRIHFFLTLSQYAFKTKHYYWGYRFLGWTLHYTQDLSQPYHASLFPGYSVAGAVARYGCGGPLAQHLANTLSNQHFAIENYQYHYLHNAIEKNIQNDLLMNALETNDPVDYYRSYDDFYPRQVIAKESYDNAKLITSSLMSLLNEYGYDTFKKPNEINLLDDSKTNLFAQMKQDNPKTILFNQQLAMILREMNAHTKKIIRFAMQA